MKLTFFDQLISKLSYYKALKDFEVARGELTELIKVLNHLVFGLVYWDSCWGGCDGR